jgi:predicted phosphoribosyltransferase
MNDDLFLFINRDEAGEKLAARLLDEPLIKAANRDELLVLSIPRGGVVVGAAIARALGCDHDVVVAKKIALPDHEEAAIGAMAEDGTLVLNPWMRQAFKKYIDQATEQTRRRIKNLIRKFRQGRDLDLHAKVVIIVDDGAATGETMKAVITWIALQEPAQRPKERLIALPVCSPQVARELAKMVDKFIYLAMPEIFWAVSQVYWDFDQVGDEEVIELLRLASPKTHYLFR